MNARWTLALPLPRANLLGPLRGRAGLKVCQQDQTLWLLGESSDDRLQAQLSALPGIRYAVLPDEQLVRLGIRVPTARLPSGPWCDLRLWLTVELEPTALGGELAAPATWQVVRGGTVKPANILVTPFEAWLAYASGAPEIRLQALVFAVAEGAVTVIKGSWLPPLPGTRYVERDGIAVPAGYEWRPAIDAAVLRQVLGLSGADVALLHANGTWDKIGADDFTRAARSAVRLTAAAIRAGSAAAGGNGP